MELIHWALDTLRNPGPLIQMVGYPGLATIIFLETGALIFFLPGDSLLFVAGLYAAQAAAGAGEGAQAGLNIWILNLLLIPCAIIGDALSYYIGVKSGPRLFSRPKSRFFDPKHMQTAHDFYEKHGGKAIIIARFMPIVRTFVPVVAGIAKMSYPKFASFNVIGGIAWVSSMTLGGYFLGRAYPILGQHIEKVIIVIVILSILPGLIGWLRGRGKSASDNSAVAAEPSSEA